MTNLTRHPRYDQMFPVLEPPDIERLKRFGSNTAYRAGTRVVTSGSIAPGFIVLLSGKIDVSQETRLDRREVIVTYGAGQFTGELAQLSARPALVDADVIETPQPPLSLPIAFATFRPGSRAGRADNEGLDTARANLLEVSAGGPIIIWTGRSADVIRLQGFSAPKREPYCSLILTAIRTPPQSSLST